MHEHNWYKPAELAGLQKQAQDLLATYLLQECAPELHRGALRSATFRQTLAASVEVFRPGTALAALKLCEHDNATAAVELVREALTALITRDPDIIAPEPTRDEAYSTALQWLNEVGSPIDSDRRAHLWTNFAESGTVDDRRLTVYKMRRVLKERAVLSKPRAFGAAPARESAVRSGAIGGGPQKKAELADAHESTERPGKISGVTPTTANSAPLEDGERPRGENPGMIGR